MGEEGVGGLKMGDDETFAPLTIRSYGRAQGSPEQTDPSLAHPLGTGTLTSSAIAEGLGPIRTPQCGGSTEGRQKPDCRGWRKWPHLEEGLLYSDLLGAYCMHWELCRD